MDFAQLAKARYSLRQFSDRPVEPEILQTILEAGCNGPTAHNCQPQRIFVLQSEDALARADACMGFHFHPPVILAVGYDPNVSWHRTIDNKDNGEIDASIAVSQMMLQAADLGLGSTFVGFFDLKKVAELFPEMAGLKMICMLNLGYPAEDARPAKLHTDRRPMEETVRYL